MVDDLRAELDAEKRAAATDNLIQAWAALRAIYEVAALYAPPGSLPPEDRIITPAEYAEHISRAIEAIAGAGRDKPKS